MAQSAAGSRFTESEGIGIEVSERYLRWANVVLVCGDTTESLDQAVDALAGKTNAPIIKVKTKSDLEPDTSNRQTGPIWVSAETGEGLTHLLDSIDRCLSTTVGQVITDLPLLTRSRHIHGIREAREEMSAFIREWKDENLPSPVAAVHLRAAVTALESLIGAVSTEDVLDRVFGSFCVGK